jgi:hypothetical protein
MASRTKIVKAKKPRLHFAYFSGLDEDQHESAPFTPRVEAPGLDLRLGGLVAWVLGCAGTVLRWRRSKPRFRKKHPLSWPKSWMGCGIILRAS